MRHAKTIILVIVLMAILQGNLFSLITSRIEGVVVDADTEEIISDAKVSLYITDVHGDFFNFFKFHTESSKEGTFSFELKNLVKPNVGYYIQCKKDGYISLIPEYYFTYGKKEVYAEMLQVFQMEEGQVKHLKVRLSKGGILKGKFLKKDSSGITPLEYVAASLYRKTNPNERYLKEEKSGYKIAQMEVDEKGEFEIKGIEPFGNYNILISQNGYVSHIIEGIVIVLNNVSTIKETVDVSNQTGIHGSIRIKNVNPDSGIVFLIRDNPDKNLSYKDLCQSFVDKDGYYSCRGLNPGVYRLKFRVYKNGIEFKKEIVVYLEKGILKTTDIEF